MNGVKYLLGNEDLNPAPLPVYSDEALDYLAALSAELLKTPGVRAYPDVVSVAFWCRRANLQKLKEQYRGDSHRLGRGLAFHITPGNIPVNFAFSFFFSLLAGNANLVRIPSKPYPQVSVILETMRSVMRECPEISARAAFVTYPADATATADFCALADARIIWGGDRTVAEIRRFPTKPRCVDVVFPDRYSICILDGDAVLDAEENVLTRLAESFYNDTYLMDQNACSSPQLILWKNGSATARERFWDAVSDLAMRRYRLQDMTAVDKYVQLCGDAIECPEAFGAVHQEGNLLYRVQLSALPKSNADKLRGQGGYFYEYNLSSIDEIGDIVNEKFQTVSYFGIDPEEVRNFVMERRLTGIDRIVPVGRAMDIGVVWDGYDLITMLSRVIDVR